MVINHGGLALCFQLLPLPFWGGWIQPGSIPKDNKVKTLKNVKAQQPDPVIRALEDAISFRCWRVFSSIFLYIYMFFSISTYFACFTRIHDFLFVHVVHLVYFNPIYKSRSAQCLWEPHLPSTEMKQTLMLFWQEYIGGGNCSKLVFDAACQSLNHFETCLEQRTLAGSFTSAYFARTTRPCLFRKMFQLPAQLRRITVCRKQPQQMDSEIFWGRVWEASSRFAYWALCQDPFSTGRQHAVRSNGFISDADTWSASILPKKWVPEDYSTSLIVCSMITITYHYFIPQRKKTVETNWG